MELFNSNRSINVGILLDLNLCKLPVNEDGAEKYIFLNNGNTNIRWWIKGNAIDFARFSQSLKVLRRYLRELQAQRQIPSHNELLAKLQRKAVRGVFATKDLITNRLNALDKKFLLLQWLKIDVPVLIITKEHPALKYDISQWFNDLIDALNGDKTAPAYGYATKIIRYLITYNEKIWNDFYKKINKIDPMRALFVLNYAEINNQKVVDKSQFSLLNDLTHFGISEPTIAYLEKCEILHWLIIKESPFIEYFSKNILNDHYTASKCIKVAIEHQYFDVVRMLLKYSQNQQELVYYQSIDEAFLLLYVYTEHELARNMLLKIHPKLCIPLVGTSLAGKKAYEFLTDKEIQQDCTTNQLDCMLYELVKSKENYPHLRKILELREDIPYLNWKQHQNKKNVLHYLIEEKEPDFDLIKKMAQRMPSLLTDEDETHETPLSLAAKLTLEDLFKYFWALAEKINYLPTYLP